MFELEFIQDIRVGELLALNELLGLVVEVNDGAVSTAYICLDDIAESKEGL